MEHEAFVGPAEIALLGLLAEGPQHPWELSKQVAYREMRTWTELSQSTIYKQLRALQARGLVKATEIAVSGRLRHQYSITEAGRQAVEEGILNLLITPSYPRWPIDIASYNIDLVDPNDAMTALAQYAETLRERAGDWARLEDFLRGLGCPSHRWALANRARHMIDGELRWVEEFSAELAQRATSHQHQEPDHQERQR
ncbi:MAG: PadR family transcriptional regulator [Dactylosporangium sp.]|nr:PadR family transcriptional regulator [Dactylosporangium sp.]NNJ60300.1 PadR family transcriptional regulator [Dactylosporangium sp.]